MEETLATCATAFVTADPGRMEWTIGNDRIRKTVTWRAHGGLRLTALENRTTGRVWQPALDASSFAGGEFLVQWEAVTYSARQATELLGIDVDGWKSEVPEIEEFLNKAGDRLPARMQNQLAELKKRVGLG